MFAANGVLKARVTVKNTGKRDGKEVVQLYVRDKISSVSQPIQAPEGLQEGGGESRQTGDGRPGDAYR